MDMELKQAFADLQRKMVETQSQMKIADAQIMQLGREKKRSELTASEISGLPSETRLFQSVGRMFLLRTRDEIDQNLKASQENSDTKVKELEAKKKYLEKTVKESEENLREMVSQRRK
ncbi:prefoldin subunit 1-like [Styela clava]